VNLSRAFVAAITLAVASLGHPSLAHADSKKCEIDDFSGTLECTLIASPGPPAVVRLSQVLPLEWIRMVWTDADGLSNGRGCVRTNAGIREIGVAWAVSLRDTETRQQLILETVCEWPGDVPPQPPPRPPTPEQLAQDNARALTLQPALSPPVEIGGLTGLDSWLWCDDPGSVSADAELNGWTASGAVDVVKIGWEVDGPTGVVTNTTTCGSPDAPAVSWTPETVGDYRVLVTTVWAGTWDLTYNGIPIGTYPLGPLTLTASAQTYPVDEYRGVLSG
jgi:hypothetical protein